MLRVGLIGLDTSHVAVFTRLLNDTDDPHHISGARVVTGWRGGSSDFELSHRRVPQFTEQLRDTYGVAIADTPERVADESDVVLMTAVDGRVHRALFERICKAGKPVFIDKPFTTSLADARAIFELAEMHGIAVMSASSLRFADTLSAGLAQLPDETVQGADIHGPMNLESALPGLFWYGIHSVDIAVQVMGPRCTQVDAVSLPNHDLFTLRWDDGRTASMHGLRNVHSKFGVTLHRKSGASYLDLSQNARPYYASLLQAILETLPRGQSAVPMGDTLASIAIIEACNRALATGQPQVVERTFPE